MSNAQTSKQNFQNGQNGGYTPNAGLPYQQQQQNDREVNDGRRAANR